MKFIIDIYPKVLIMIEEPGSKLRGMRSLFRFNHF